MTPLTHLDEHGRTCERHPATDDEIVEALALIGSRVPSFNHDIASKIQSLMMALDEIDELVGPRADADLARAVETARLGVTELGELLAANRALTKPPVVSRIVVRDLVARAAMRVGVRVRGELPATELELPAPRVLQALALAIDVAAGTDRNRTLEIAGDGSWLRLPLAATAGTGAPGAMLALAASGLASVGGALCCRTDGVIEIRLPRGS